MEFFPYKLRKNQEQIMSTILRVLEDGKDFVFESGTGSGKTICAASAALSFAVSHQKKIIYTTRTNAQQRQVILELRGIRSHLKTNHSNLFGLGMQGRGNMCLLARNDPEFASGSAEELSKVCAAEKKKVTSGKKKGCPYYRTFLSEKDRVDAVKQQVKETLPTAEELIDLCEKQKLCPYELNKELIPEATLIVVPYIYVFDTMIRNMLLDWCAVGDEDVVVIVDEAHNLPDYLRDLFSAYLSYWMLTSCVQEAEKYGDPSLADGTCSVSVFCKHLLEILQDLRDTYVYQLTEGTLQIRNHKEQQDAFLPSHEMETELMARLKITSRTLRDCVKDLIAYGEKIQEYRQKEGSLPRSYLHKLGVFLEFWTTVEMDQYIKLVVDDSNGRNPRIEAYCVDPSLGARVLEQFHGSIHMSGTLEPLEEYRDSLGLSRHTELVTYPSPFPKENRLLLYAKDVSTKYSDLQQDITMIERMTSHIRDVCNQFPRNTMVFFPSFNTMKLFTKNGLCNDINRCLYVEEQGMSQAELMTLVEDFKQSGHQEQGAALFSVIGGRISEGMDFPDEQLEIAVLVGIPYPKPSARQRGLQRYYDMKFGKGWEYTVKAPTARKLLQSIGRLIRTEQDRGVAVILDKRAVRFQQYLTDLKPTSKPLEDIHHFLQQ